MNEWIFLSLLSHSGFLSLVCVVLPLAQISMTSSIFLTVCIAVERYTTVCHPFYKVTISDSRFVFNERHRRKAGRNCQKPSSPLTGTDFQTAKKFDEIKTWYFIIISQTLCWTTSCGFIKTKGRMHLYIIYIFVHMHSDAFYLKITWSLDWINFLSFTQSFTANNCYPE